MLVCLAVSSAAQAQHRLGFEQSDALDLTTTLALENPAIGGMSHPQFSEIDLDGDGVQDLFVFDRAADTWMTFLYDEAIFTYSYAPSYEQHFPRNMKEFALLRDFDCDGLQDIFTYHNGGFRVYRQSELMEFSLVTDAIQTDYGSIVASAYVLPGDLPAIVDVDFDGDLDVLAFGNGDAENTIVWHENRSMDELGNCDSLWFVVNTECWGGVMEPTDGSALQQISCKPVSPPNNDTTLAHRRHPGSTLHLSDIDADQDMDLILGDIQTEALVFAPNIGTGSSAEIDPTQQTTQFPTSLNPADMQYMVSAFDIDVNHDGFADLILSTNNNIDSSCNTGHTWYYRMAPSSGIYSLQQRDFLLDQMLDLGTGIVPRWFDADGDGLQDLLLAVDFMRSPTQSTGSRLYLFTNDGTAQSAQFTLEDSNYAALDQFNFNGAHPALGDLDGDGDTDMIIGDLQGNLHYFTNSESNGVASFSLSIPNYMGIDIGQYAAPELVDLNGDQLLDLVVGQRNGTMSYFENTGSATQAAFSSAATIAPLGDIDVSFFCCNGYAAPRFYNNAALSDFPIMVVGTSEKQVLMYAVPDDVSEAFVLLDSIWINANRAVPLLADFDSDGVIELLIGTGEGGLKYYDRESNVKVGIRPTSSQAAMPQLIPNPTRSLFTVKGLSHAVFDLGLFNLQGQLVKVVERHDAHAPVHVAGVHPGHYIVHIYTEGQMFNLPLIIQE